MAGQNNLDEISRARQLIDAIDDVIADISLTPLERAVLIAGLNSDLHYLMVRASRNHLLPTVLRPAVRTFLSFTLSMAYSAGELRHSHKEHREIVRALAARDGDAAERAMRCDVRSGLNVLLREQPHDCAALTPDPLSYRGRRSSLFHGDSACRELHRPLPV